MISLASSPFIPATYARSSASPTLILRIREYDLSVNALRIYQQVVVVSIAYRAERSAERTVGVGALREDTVTVRVNPLLAQFFSFNSVKADEMLYSVTSPVVLDDLLKWEKMYNKFRKLEKQYGKSEKEEKTQTGSLRGLPKGAARTPRSIGKPDALGELSEVLEKIELEVQRSDVLLDRVGGIAVKLPKS